MGLARTPRPGIAEASAAANAEASAAANAAASAAVRPPAWGTATAFLTVLTLVSASAFSRVFLDSRWVGPVLATALATHGFCALLRRRRLVDPLPILLGLAFVAVLSVYLVLPGSLSFGLPLGRSWTAVHQQLLAARLQIQSLATPIPASPALSMLAAWAVGAAAVLADWLTFRVQAALQGAAPPFAVFVLSCALGSRRDRSWTVGLEVAALAAFLLAHRVTVSGRGLPSFGGRPARTGTTLAAGAGVAAVAVAAAVSVVPLLPSAEGTGLLGWKSLNHSSGRVTPSPFDDLRTRLIDEASVEVMTVRSSVPSYWRLTSLDTFNGEVWESTNSYEGVSGRLPGVHEAPGTETVDESFHIEALDSIWLPTAFDPKVVRADRPVTWDPQSDSLLSSRPTSNGENYEVTSVEELAKLSPAALSSVPSTQPGSVDGDLRLPAQIPQNVVRLAAALTATQPTEYAKAYALEQYFHQAPFAYTTNPPSDDSTSALEDFLFQTHEGYCQQFAGAYAVLARLAGLPTRIAIGFQAGTLEADGRYHVTDADAHAWPEVYFPTVGWVPFEPTPGRQVPGAAAYTGFTAKRSPSASTPTSTTTPTQNPTFHRPQAAPSATTLPPAATSTARASAAGGSALTALGIAAGVLFAAGAGWIGALAAWRGRRWRRRRERAPDPGLVAWEETVERLSWWDARRTGDETIGEFAARTQRDLGYLLDGSSDRHGVAPAGDADADGGLPQLARLAERAAYGAGPTGPEEAERAVRIAAALGRRLLAAMPWRRRLAVLFLPRYSRPAVPDPITVEAILATDPAEANAGEPVEVGAGR